MVLTVLSMPPRFDTAVALADVADVAVVADVVEAVDDADESRKPM